MKLQREIDVMKHALDVVIPELEGLVQAVDTSEEERKFCLKDLEKLEHAVQYYHWLQQFVDELGEENYFADKRRS